ncbi:hypothetical protein [Aromatoleum toluvorans]|uniref:hypothetical protein n=1 Tax=Aromatoleum toluvorans TaxID=92002 RepID=UPI00145C750F|nr:hypothetical protein [Aromatoleum toluvorans]
MRWSSRTSRAALLALWAVLASAAAPEAAAQPGPAAAMDPARTASLSAASRRIEDHFVAEVARIAGTTPDRVRRAMPDERRITSAASRLISALEVDLGAPLTPEQQTEILEADQARKLSLMKAREAARGR